MTSLRFILLISILATTSLFGTVPSAFALSSQAVGPYAQGLDALNEGHWHDAVSAFSRALDQSGDDPDIVLARGVANTLAEDFPRAQKDLGRAQRLGLKGREAQLWLWATEAMSGIIVVPDHALGGGPRSLNSGRPAVVSIPGHVAQGGQDYSSDYGSFIVYRLAMEYQKHRLPRDSGGSGNPNGTKGPQMRQAMLKAGQLFAERNYRRPELASINVSRAKQATGGKATGGSMAHVERALASNPGDPDARYQAGMAWLDAERPARARREFTIALTLRTDFPEAYLGRATAAARLSDEKRMDADLAVYKKEGWLSTRSARSAVEDELGRNRITGSDESFLKELQDAARSDKPMEQLIAIASKLHRVMEEQRLRYDEIYQERLRTLDEAVRENPKNEDARIPAYLGVVNEEDDKLDEAAALYRVAVALEEARLRLDELKPETGAPLGRDALEFGLAIQARFHLARLAEHNHKQAEALTQYQAVLGYEKRMNRGFESRQMFTAMWPDQKPEKGAVVMAPKNASTLVAEAHLRTGKLLSTMGKHDESIEHLRGAATYGPLRMAGMPQIGNANGDTNFGGLAGAPAAEAQFYLAKELMAKGDLEGAQRVLYEVGRDLPDDLRGQLNELNMAMARLHSRRPRDPYSGMTEEKRPYIDMQMQQDQERSRMAVRQMAPRARVVPEVVGRWEMTPNNQFLPKKTLTIEADAKFTLVSTDGSTSQGKMDIQIGRDPVRGRPEPSRGQMMLYEETSGQIGTMWYEFTGEGLMEITEMDSTKYATKRQR
ncbi:MAG: tetratricopeptide repeat protein [Nitrospira sp.]